MHELLNAHLVKNEVVRQTINYTLRRGREISPINTNSIDAQLQLAYSTNPKNEGWAGLNRQD